MCALDEHLILVEGKRDRKALESVGVASEIIEANGKPDAIVGKAKAGGRRVLLLFDFDDEGTRKTRVFEELFEQNGLKTNPLLRKRFGQLFRITCVEELPFWHAKALGETG